MCAEGIFRECGVSSTAFSPENATFFDNLKMRK
jgi:hypothetical protein